MTSAELVALHGRLEALRVELWGLRALLPARARRHCEKAAGFVLEAQSELRVDIGQAVLDEAAGS